MAENAEETALNQSFWDFKGAEDYIDKWPLMGSPWGVLLLLTSYLFLVLHCGPKFMKNRPPYKLRNVLLLYNAFQVAFSCYLCKLGVDAISEMGILESGCIINDPHFKYRPPKGPLTSVPFETQTSDDKFITRITSGHYLYFLAKLSEFLDTIFFVLRKKWDQISFLHVYHHAMMFVCAWTVLKYEPTFSLVFLGTANSFVHVIMYGYYGLSAFPKLQKYLWWKKYITKMQLIQFLLIMIHVQSNFIVSDCRPSYIILSLTWFHVLLFIYLFTDFYVKSYIKKRRENKEKSSANETAGKENNILNTDYKNGKDVKRRNVIETR